MTCQHNVAFIQLAPLTGTKGDEIIEGKLQQNSPYLEKIFQRQC